MWMKKWMVALPQYSFIFKDLPCVRIKNNKEIIKIIIFSVLKNSMVAIIHDKSKLWQNQNRLLVRCKSLWSNVVIMTNFSSGWKKSVYNTLETLTLTCVETEFMHGWIVALDSWSHKMAHSPSSPSFTTASCHSYSIVAIIVHLSHLWLNK